MVHLKYLIQGIWAVASIPLTVGSMLSFAVFFPTLFLISVTTSFLATAYVIGAQQ